MDMAILILSILILIPLVGGGFVWQDGRLNVYTIPIALAILNIVHIVCK